MKHQNKKKEQKKIYPQEKTQETHTYTNIHTFAQRVIP